MPAPQLIAALAHAGHHEPGADALLHALTQPDHLLAAAACVAGAYVAVAAYRRLASRQTAAVQPLTPSPLYSGGRAGVGGSPTNDARLSDPAGADPDTGRDAAHSAVDKGQG